MAMPVLGQAVDRVQAWSYLLPDKNPGLNPQEASQGLLFSSAVGSIILNKVDFPQSLKRAWLTGRAASLF
jgi:hypothetical protein